MIALTRPSIPLRESAYPTPNPSPNGHRIPPTSLTVANNERLALPDYTGKVIKQSNGPGLPTTPVPERKVGFTTVSPYFTKKKIETRSPYFPSPPTIEAKASEQMSCIPFPPLHSTSFGLIQEALARNPFRLLIAAIFLNKTRGHVALPVFYELMERYPNPADLAAADLNDVVDIIQHLGLQNQRAAKCIGLAKAWLERPPEKGKRYRLLHYPRKDNGKDIKVDEVIDEDDKRVGWEIGQLPGVGAYAIDSWRIFCRDKLRGVATGLPNELTPEAKEADLEKEWARVLPRDKELRAYLHWRWLRNGWEWNPLNGDRKRADVDAMAKAGQGGVMYECDSTNSTVGEKEINAFNTVKVGPYAVMAPEKILHGG